MSQESNKANTPIMPNIANMARKRSAPNAVTVRDMFNTADRADAPFKPNKSNRPITLGIANTVIMPDIANMARAPSAPEKPNKPSYFKLPPQKPRYDKHDYRRSHLHKKPHYKQVFDRAHEKFDKDHERAEQTQARQIRALAWWQAWHHLQAAQHEMAVRTLCQINVPCPTNLAYLQAA